MKTKFIFITGGVLSSLGKGLSAASIGALLKTRGLTVTIQKLDPYINVDPGTMNPYQHGEVYVTDDGAETDLDLGHYERYLNTALSQKNNTTSGSIYYKVITKERHGDYIHLTLVPYLRSAGEHKTKPTQHSVKELRSIGIQPDIILCRCEEPVPADLRAKIALFCNVDKDAVFSAVDVSNIYELPLKLYEEGLDQKVAIMLRLPARNAKLEPWEELVHNVKNPQGRVTIAIVGKYVELKEAYKSLHEALVHGGIANRVAVDLRYVNSEEVTAENVAETFKGADGILVPGGFGYRGVEGKIESIRYARENNVPFFGICLGMQCAVIEFARHVVGIEEANSEEFNPFAKDKSPDGTLVEIVEIPNHPWFLGCQFHPEFQSRPMKPHPLFKDFIRASCLARKK